MLKLQDISYVVEENGANKTILDNINLTFEDKKIYVITGPNGSGKSTLVKMIMGIETPTTGNIVFNGISLDGLQINERANLGISYAFQQPVKFKGLKVRDLLDAATGKSNDFKTLCNYLSAVGLCARDYIDRPLDGTLSGGELKRIELAMAICRKSKLNIFDEPEAGIDLWSFENLTKIFKSLGEATNIIVSHQKKILEIADEVILLKGGRVEKVGKYKQVLPYIQNTQCDKLRGEHE